MLHVALHGVRSSSRLQEPLSDQHVTQEQVEMNGGGPWYGSNSGSYSGGGRFCQSTRAVCPNMS